MAAGFISARVSVQTRVQGAYKGYLGLFGGILGVT